MRRATPLIVLVALCLAACGGGSGSSAKSSSSKNGKSDAAKSDTLSEKEFQKQANKICKDAESELSDAQGSEALDRPESEGAEEFQKRFFVEQTAPSIEEQLDQIADLGAPDSIADDVDKLVKDARKALRDFVKALEDNPDSVDLTQNPFADIDRQSKALGLDECAT
jgi:hypothetical protein